MSTANTSNINNSKVRMPAEWERHAACLILYPHNAATFRDNCVPAQYQVLEVARAIATHGNENVLLFCNSERSANELRAKLTDKDERISVELCPSDDTWARDTGPTFVIQESSNECELVGISWNFNAYGGEKEGCYWPCETDKQVAKRMCQVLSRRLDMTIPTRAVPIVLEGGSIHTDGEGTILTTEECLLNPNRNPRLSKRDIETTVLSALGCTKVIWLPFGLAADDDTNGHVDNLACFSQPGHVVLSWTDDAEGDAENYMRCRRAMEVLEKETDAKGRPLTIHKLHLPPPMYYTKEEVSTLASVDGALPRHEGERLAASYANFYIANDAIIVPQFGIEPFDSQAIRMLEEMFRERKVVGVSSREILLGGGNIHCITQQLPKVA